MMRLLAVIFGIVLILLVAQDAFETIVLPRRVTRRLRLAKLFYRVALLGGNSMSHMIRSSARRDSFRAYLAPLSLLGLLIFWAALFILGYGLLLWGLTLPLSTLNNTLSFPTYLYLSSTTFFTLGLGDVSPLPGLGRFLLVSEAALGFIFLALVISYVPVLYQAFSRRELRISLLDARAGSPGTAVELLRRNCIGRAANGVEELRLLLHDWEVWCADILETHLSYPILAFYRSQHEQQSWVGALTIILDTCALVLTTIDGDSSSGAPVEAAKFTFAMARHAVIDLAQILGISPPTAVNRLSSAEFTQLQDILMTAGLRLQESQTSEQKLSELRATYEPFVSALAERIQVSLPPWIPPKDTLDDWQTSAWDDRFPSIRETLNKMMHPR
jgi:hypothetical protein